jgi:hypothetical protein
MNTHRRRPVAAAALAAALLAGPGCSAGDDPKTLSISGDCALGEDTGPTSSSAPAAPTMAWTTLVPKATLERLVAPDAYKTTPGLVVMNDKLPAAFDGNCDLTRASDGQDVLRLGLVNRKDPRYAEAKTHLAASGDADGYTRIDDRTYVVPSDRLQHGAKAVAVLPDRAVVLEVVRPAKGTDASKDVGPMMVALAKKIETMSGPAMFTGE